jgi:hypothetical protein
MILLLSSAPIPGYQKHPPEIVRWLDRTSLAANTKLSNKEFLTSVKVGRTVNYSARLEQEK